MKLIPEWFIGGPLHGEDRRKVFPRDQFGPFKVPPEPGKGDGNPFWYHRQRFTIGNRVIVFWWGYDTSQEVAASMLADLLLAPHEFETERRTEPDPCICTDSVHSFTGTCPTKCDEQGYASCPRRRFSEPEIIRRTAEIRKQAADEYIEWQKAQEPDNTGDSDRWEDPRDTFGWETANETGKKGEPA